MNQHAPAAAAPQPPAQPMLTELKRAIEHNQPLARFRQSLVKTRLVS